MIFPFPERYEVSGPLGQGGGGEVWSAIDRATKDRVALKILRALSGPREVEALIRETTALSGLEGLGFPRVLELGRTADGRLYQVRELVPGESLERAHEKDPERALSLLPGLADVLTVVHRTGLLHGDVKPANVIARPDGSVALVDLGLATALREGGNPALGLTPHFAAPEVLAGRPLTVQGEIYSLGVILRDWLEGRAPSETTHALRLVAARALEAEPNDRFPSADEFGSAIRTALRGDVPPAGPALVPWPVLGVDAVAFQLRRALDEAPGERIRLVGPEGSGRSTIVRRLAWTLALEGRPVALVDEALGRSSWVREVTAAAERPSGVVFVDASSNENEAAWLEAEKKGAQLVFVTREVPEGTGRGRVVVVPELDESRLRELLRGALPSLPLALVADVRELVGARPLALRRFVEAAEQKPLVSRDDIVTIVTGSLDVGGDDEDAAERALDRGHYGAARRALDRLTETTARRSWLEARYEVGAGSAARALEIVEAALRREPAVVGLDFERLEALLGRALLGVGRYADALERLVRLDDYAHEVRAEARAYRGLAETLLGDLDAARRSLERAEQEANELGVDRIVALTSSSRGTAEWRAGRLDEAISAYERAIAAASRGGDSGMLASAQINLAGLKKEHGDLAASIQLLEGATDAARRAGRQSSLQQALLNLTNADLYLGRLERARAELARVADPDALPPALRAQLHGLRAELAARSGDVEVALVEYEICGRAFDEIGRKRDASEPFLEAVLLLCQVARDGAAAPGKERFVPSEELIARWLEEGRARVGDEPSPLLRLAEARFADFRGDSGRAEEWARDASRVARDAGHREWAWRALALEAELAEAAGKKTRAQKAREEATEILEEIGARLPPDLRAVYWNDPRRRELRAELASAHFTTGFTASPVERRGAAERSGAGRSAGGATGTEAVSRLTQTPLERRLARILAINSDLASEIDLGRLSTKIVAHAAELLGAERGYLLLGETADTLEVRASRAAQAGEKLAFSRSIASEVLRTGAPLVSIDAERDLRLQGFESVHAALVSAVACVPVLSPRGVPIGAIYLETRLGVRPDFKDELPTLQAFADQAAIALENARLVREIGEKKDALEKQNQKLEDAQSRLRELLGRRTARLREVREELRSTRDKLQTGAGFRGLVGTSAAMRRVYALIERVQETDVPVLITGESGTGKEVVARAIHEGSARSEQKMLAVNCGAIPESILESELFGHKKGAFTGADRDRKGLFLEAQGGSLFLDEIGETPLKMQAGLLRVLQERRVRSVGGSDEQAVDVRVIFATNRDLAEAVKNGTFREDLLYRIQVVEIALPPLRKRREDIPLLVDHFLGRFAARFGQEKKTLSREALARLVDHPLPGNVRQLENTLLNAWVLSEGAEIGEDDIALPRVSSPSTPPLGDAPRSSPGSSSGSTPYALAHGAPRPQTSPEHGSAQPAAAQGTGAPGSGGGLSERLSDSQLFAARAAKKKGTWSEHQRTERDRIVAALERTAWNRVRAAELLGMPRRTFYRRLRDYGIQ